MLVKDIKLFSKKKKKKTDNMVVKDTKIPSEDEKQKMVEYRKKNRKWEKMASFNYKKLFPFRKINTFS